MTDIQSKITDLTDKLMADYGKGRVIDEIKMFAYPDRNIIIDIKIITNGFAYITKSVSCVEIY